MDFVHLYITIVVVVLLMLVLTLGPWTNSFWKKVWNSQDYPFPLVRKIIFGVLVVSAVLKAVMLFIAKQ